MNRSEFLALTAAAPFALRSALTAPLPAALVTCDAEARLAVVDLGGFHVLRSIRTVADPRAIELVGDRAVVCHTAVGAVSIVDRHGVRHVLRGLVEPRYTVAHPDRRHAFVTDSGRSSVTALDVATGRALGRVKLPGWARHLTIDRAGRRLWVSLGSTSEHVAVVDVAALRHTATLTPGWGAQVGGGAPVGRLGGPAGGARGLAVGDVVHAADEAPQHVTFGDGKAFVTSGDAGVLRVQDLAGQALRSTPIPIGSYNVQYGFGRVITASLGRGTLTVLDRRGALLARVQVSSSCHDACFLPA